MSTSYVRTLRPTTGWVSIELHELAEFRDLLVEEIAETVSDADEIDGEIAYLLRAVSE